MNLKESYDYDEDTVPFDESEEDKYKVYRNGKNARLNDSIDDNSASRELDLKDAFMEGYAAGGVAVVVEAMTDNKNRTAGDVRSYFTKFNGNLGETGCVGWMFDKKGCITFNKDDVDYEKLFEAAINLDAEDITEEEEEYKVYTSIPNLQPITEGLEAEGFKAVSAEFTRVPQNTIEVTDEKTAINIMRLLNRLEEHDDVQNVYANFDIDDDLMTAIENSI